MFLTYIRVVIYNVAFWYRTSGTEGRGSILAKLHEVGRWHHGSTVRCSRCSHSCSIRSFLLRKGTRAAEGKGGRASKGGPGRKRRGVCASKFRCMRATKEVL